MGFRVNSAKSSQKKQKKNEPRHRRKKPQHINPSRRVVQSSRAWAARGGMFTFFSTTEGNTTPGRKKSKALKQLTVWVFCMFHQVSARCLRRQSSVSTAVFFGCLCVRFFPLLSCHGEGGREGGICKLEMWFLFFSFFLIWNQERKKKSVWRGAVLGDETAVSVAGCNTSSHCRGWLEGLRAHGEPPSTRFYMCICVFLGHDERGRSFHSVVTLCIYILFLFIPFWLTWLREVRAGKKKRGVLLDSRSTWVGDFFTGEYGGVRLIMMRDWSHRAPSPFPLVAF